MIIELVNKLKEKGVKLSAVDGKLNVDAPKDSLDNILISKIKEYRDELIYFVLNNEYFEIPKAAKKTSYELSNAQRRFWILNQIEENSIVYNIPRISIIEGEFYEEAFRQAYCFIADRHESLRTVFVIDEGEPKQKILDSPSINLVIHDLRCSSDKERRVHEYKSENIIKPFNLEEGPLVRFTVLKIEDFKFIVLFNMHHIISDAWSFRIFINELTEAYTSFINNEKPFFRPLRIQYKDYAAWQNTLLNSPEIAIKKKYWLEKLSGEIPVLELPCDNVRPAAQTFVGKSYNMCFDKEMQSNIRKVCNDNNISLFMFLQAIVKILFHKYTGQEDIIIGTPVAGRNHEDLKYQIGVFTNTLAFRDSVKRDMLFIDFLKMIRITCIDAYHNQEYPFDKLVSDLKLKRDFSRSPLFDVMLVFQDSSSFLFNKSDIPSYNNNNVISRYDMTFEFTEYKDLIHCNIEFNTDIYSEDRIERMESHLKVLISSILSNPELKIKDLKFISKEEKNLLINVFNDTKEDYPWDKTIIDLFEEQVEKTPDNIAIVFENIELTYRELNEKANIVGHYLRDKYDIKPDDLIGVFLNRSEKMIIALLGILKAGAAYVPIDPDFPEERIDYMIQDSNPKVVICESCNNLYIDINEILQSGASILNLVNISSPDNLAYAIYTSGSTGKPKGTLICNKALVNFIHGITKQIDFKSEKIIVSVTTFSFDIFVLELYIPLSKGQKIVLANKEQQSDSYALEALIKRNKVDMIQTTPSRIKLLASEDSFLSTLSNLSDVMIGGEALPEELLEKLNIYCMGNIFNMYGPTETTVWSSMAKLNNKISVNIGSPIINTQFYILDKSGDIVPIGVFGELNIAGDGISSGYLGRPELTDEKFVDNLFCVGKKMYRTGDLGRWLPDGNVELLGRIDNQVKIRGYRIELEEIEFILLKHKHIESVVVHSIDSNFGKQLVAYYVSGIELTTSELSSFLGDYLPNYMVPNYFVKLVSIPLTANGKVDRKKLPEPDSRNITGVEYVAPRNNIEEIIAAIWQEVLGIEYISIYENFFELGGYSIIALKVISLLNEKGLKTDLNSFFKYPILEDFSQHIINNQKEISQKIIIGFGYITQYQKNILNDKDQSKHIQNFLVDFGQVIDTKTLFKVCNKIVNHHDALRIRYFFSDGKWHMENSKDFYINLSEHEIQDLQSIIYIKNIQRKDFCFENSQLIKFSHIIIQDKSFLLMTASSLIVDHLSWQILTLDLKKAFEQLRIGDEISLPGKTESFIKWSESYRFKENRKEYQNEVEFWNDQSFNNIELPFQNIESNILECCSFILPKDQSEALIDEVNEVFLTNVTDILITSLGKAVYQWTGNSRVGINWWTTYREEFENVDVSRTVGGFHSSYPIVITLNEQMSLGENILLIKDKLSKYKKNELGYYRCKNSVENSGIDIDFNFLGELNHDSFKITSYDNNINKLNFDCFFQDGKLTVHLASNYYDKTSLQKMNNLFETNIMNIIEYCKNKFNHDLVLFSYPKKMLLNIKPVQNTLNCVEDAILSIFESLDLEYRLMFLDSWSFSYDKDCKSGLFEDKMINTATEEDLLRTHHGISWKGIEGNIEYYLKKIISEISNRRPILIGFNMYFAPWSSSYMSKELDYHMLSISGYDENKQILYCTDTIDYQQSCILPYGMFSKGIQSISILEHKSKATKDDPIMLLTKLINHFECCNTIGNIRIMADDIRDNLCIEDEITGIPIRFSIYNTLERTRRNTLRLIEYIYSINQIDTFKNILTLFERIILQYELLVFFILKSISNIYDLEFNDVIADKLLYLASLEEEVFYKIKHYLLHNDLVEIKKSDCIANINNIYTAEHFSEPYYLELEDYYNNNSIGTTLDRLCPANICGMGIYMFMKERQEEKILSNNYLSFKFPVIQSDLLDNISCNNQNIYVNKGDVSYLAILGCAVWGDYTGEIIINLRNGFKETISIEMNDWDECDDKPEEVVLRRHAIDYYSDSGVKVETEVCLRSALYKIQSNEIVESISLPFCPTMHIFSITIY